MHLKASCTFSPFCEALHFCMSNMLCIPSFVLYILMCVFCIYMTGWEPPLRPSYYLLKIHCNCERLRLIFMKDLYAAADRSLRILSCADRIAYMRGGKYDRTEQKTCRLFVVKMLHTRRKIWLYDFFTTCTKPCLFN